MHCYTEKSQLSSAISTVTHAIASKPPMPLLEGIYISVGERGMILRCSDLMLQIECVIPSTVEEYGEIIVPGKLFADLVRKAPDSQIELQLSGMTLTLRSGRSQSTMQCMDPEEFPETDITRSDFSVTVTQKELASMIRQTEFATAQDESKPILMGVLVEQREDHVNFVSLDGFRLAMRRHDTPMTDNLRSVVVPARSLKEIGNAMHDSDDLVNLRFTDTHFGLQVGDTKITGRLLQGKFIDYRRVLPGEHTIRVLINVKQLSDSIDRAILMAREGKNNLVKFDFANDMLTITANNEVGRIHEEMPVQINGANFQIAFNARYLSDMLRILEDEDVYFDVVNNVSPCVVRPVQGNHYYFLLLPVRLFT